MAKSNKFGTFGGVFVPSILTILGVIMYLRLPMIVGEAGLWATIGIVLVAHIISVTTGLSVSSIATDKKVEAGGTYFMISRSLGLPIGGTLGLALFVGLSFSVSLYLIGFSESFLSYWGFETSINNIRLTGSIVLLAVTTLTFISTSMAIKTQYFIMAAIVLSLISIFAGQHDYAPAAAVLPGKNSAVPLMVLFGIFFPAVTGFEAGVSMSGDLKDPKKSIPTGSIMAIVVGFIVYIGLAFFFSETVNAEMLSGDSQVLLKISWIPELVIAGIWGATLSSALGSILGAPRILQATAIDKITPKIFGKGYGPTNEPRNALLLTFLIAEAGILIGELDVIARVVSIFFITTYGFLNISAAFERWTSADFRPEFKIPGWVSLIGAIACIIVMIQLDFVAMLGAIFILGLLYFYLKRKELTLDSGDAWSGVWASLVKTGLTNLMQDRLHKRNWRPNIIMFSGSPNTRTHMIELGKAIGGKLGILSAFELVKSNEKILAKSESNLEKGKDAVGYFSHKLHCRDIYEGMDQIARVYGFSGIEPNTILMGWSKQPTHQPDFIKLIKSFTQHAYNTLFLNYNPERAFGKGKTIDIWWSGSGRNIALAFSLIRHLSGANTWSRAQIRILILNNEKGDHESIHKKMRAILDSYRLDAEIKVIVNAENQEQNIIVRESAETDLTILGIPISRINQLEKHYDQINETVTQLGSSLIIHASEDFEELEIITKTSTPKYDLENLALPPLQTSDYPEITIELEKIDLNGQKTIELFLGKTIAKIQADKEAILASLHDRIVSTQSELKAVAEIPEAARRKKAIDKIKSDILFKLLTLVTKEIKLEMIPTQSQQLSEQITWLIDKTNADFRRYPKKIKIIRQEVDFTIKSTDSRALKLFKKRKQLTHRIGKSEYSNQMAYRELARFYQYQNRLIFWEKYLTFCQEDTADFFEEIRKIFVALIRQIDLIERSIWTGENWQPSSLDEVRATSEATQQKLKEKTLLLLTRPKVEFRRNLEQMQQKMEELLTDTTANKIPKKQLLQAQSTLEDFSSDYMAAISTQLNMLSLELNVHSIQNRQELLFEEYHTNLHQTVKNVFFKKIEQLQSHLQNDNKTALEKFKLEIEFDALLLEELEHHLRRMTSLTEELPEATEVYLPSANAASAEEIQELPVARMGEYFIKSRYETPVETQFEKLIDSLKRSIFTVQDAVSLTLFNIENTEEHKAEASTKYLNDLHDKLEREKQETAGALSQYKSMGAEALSQATFPLSSINILESAEDFTTGLRSYQGKQVLSDAGDFFERISSSAQKQLTRLWYSRSMALLKTRQVHDTNDTRSINSELLDIKDKISPQKQVVQSLPHYYISLFSGKSNIGKDFWISRKNEENAFKTAYQRFRSGHGGAIMILGERNSGKTTFGKFMAQSVLKNPNVYSLFPPIAGTTDANDLTAALSKATQKRGSIDQMLSRLPKDAVILINDLELFWERSEAGLNVINQVQQMINAHGHHILFVINMNPHAYKLINQTARLKDLFLDVISLQPFNAEELKDLVIKRHKSSGLPFGFSSSQINELQTAHLFDSIFSLSKGNPGATLNLWLSCIKKADKTFIQIRKPKNISSGTFKLMDPEWVAVLTQFVLHKRMTKEKIQKIFDWSDETTELMLTSLTRSGLMATKTSSVYQIDIYMYPLVVAYLKDKEVL